MKITDSRANDILYWLDDEAGNHALLFEKMTLHRDAAALIRQLQTEVQDAWHAGLDAGREQGRGGHARQPPSASVGVEGLPRYGFPDGNNPRPVPCADGYWTPWHLVQQPASVEAKDAEIEALKAEVAAQRARADAMTGEAIKHEARAKRLAEALRVLADAFESRMADEENPDWNECWSNAHALLRELEEGK